MANMSGMDQLVCINSSKPFVYNNMDIHALGEESRLMSENKLRQSFSRAPGESKSLSEKALGRLGCCNGTSYNDNNGGCQLF